MSEGKECAVGDGLPGSTCADEHGDLSHSQADENAAMM